jgi:hypothetical protein
MRLFVVAVALFLPLAGAGADLPAGWKAALDKIAPKSLEAHVSYLASDALQGRDTPSPGLEAAAAYIASRFRRAGLEPGGDDGYYQTSTWYLWTQNPKGLGLTLNTGSEIIRAAGDHLAASVPMPFKVDNASVTTVALKQSRELTADKVAGKVVAVPFDAFPRLRRRIERWKPALILVVDPASSWRPSLIDPEDSDNSSPPLIAVSDPIVVRTLQGAGEEDADFRVSAECGRPEVDEVKLRNVVAVLRGSDPVLRETAVLLTAHYDHVGTKLSGEGDRIYNGANDDASGTASVVEIAEVLAGMQERPQRSIVFVAFFGEEKGLLGSSYYARHPVFPLSRTVAGVNVEQVGRTDSSEGSRIRSVAVTGLDFSEVGAILQEAGRTTGIDVYQDPKNSDAYFTASDNISLAREGVPAHTLSTTYLFPDYHGLGDHWEKIDYENMAAVTRMIAAGVLMLANRETAPRWSDSKEAAQPYRKAWKRTAIRPD